MKAVRQWILVPLSQIPLLASRHAKGVLVTLGLLTAVMLGGMTQITFEEDVIDLLPRDSPHTAAARHVEESFPHNYYVSSIDLVIDPEKWDEVSLPARLSTPDRLNVTDEVYVRGAEEFNHFFLEHVPSATYNITLDSYVRLINYTNTGSCLWAELGACAAEPDPAAFQGLPGTTAAGEWMYLQDWTTFAMVSPQTIETAVGPGWNTTQSVFLFTPGPGQTTADVGHEAIAGFEAYKRWAPENARYDVFDREASHFTTKDPIIIDAHTNDVTKQDLLWLSPLVLVFVTAALWVAFRNFRSIAVAGTTMGIGAAWSFGLMGLVGIPVNTLNLVLVPLILGSGINYSIHVINEYLEHRSQGDDDVEAFRRTGGGAGVALFIATCTTVSGLLVMAFSPSLLMAQVGLVSSVAMTSIFILSLVFIPAALTLLPTDDLRSVFRPGRAMAWVGRTVARNRPWFLLLVLATTLVAAAWSTRVETETYGTPALNFPEDDWLREQYYKENLYFFGATGDEQWVTDFLVFEGDLTDPAFHDYLGVLETELKQSPLVRGDRIVSIRYVISEWKTIEGGTTGALVPMALEEARPDSTYPQTRAAIEETLDDLFASPFSTFGSLFFDYPDNDIGVLLLEDRSGPRFEDTEATWEGLWEIVDRVGAEHKPDDVSVSMYGNTATSYLFVKEELPWLRYMAVVAFLVVVGLVYLFTGKLRPTLAVGTLVGLTSVWWLGVLPVFGIGLSITLMLPMAFIMSIGSDYAVHLAWNIERQGDADRVFATTGKGVFYSAVTDGGAFLIFTAMTYLLMQRSMVATSLAIGIIFLATVLVLPLFYAKAFPRETER